MSDTFTSKMNSKSERMNAYLKRTADEQAEMKADLKAQKEARDEEA